MKRFFLMVLVAMFLMGCGGGGRPVIPPPARDLSGLEGVWIGNAIVTGVMHYPDAQSYYGLIGDVQFNETDPVQLTITRNSITGHMESPVGVETIFEWHYDGSVLTIENSTSNTYNEPACGDGILYGQLNAVIQIDPGATNATIGGSLHLSDVSADCGNGEGDFTLSGNIHR